MKLATVLKLNEEGNIKEFNLMRMKLELEHINQPIINPAWTGKIVSNKDGCIELLRFYLKGHQRHLCKIYKRIRDNEDKTRKVHDYKIKVVQELEPKTFDYIVLRRLPKSLEKIKGYLQTHLHVKFNKRIVPHPILHLQL
jgi:uncharacterized membrane protein